MQLDLPLRPAKPSNEIEILRRHLVLYRQQTCDVKMRDAIDIILEKLQDTELRRFTPKQLFCEVNALRQAISIKMKHPEVDAIQTFEEIKMMLFNDECF